MKDRKGLLDLYLDSVFDAPGRHPTAQWLYAEAYPNGPDMVCPPDDERDSYACSGSWSEHYVDTCVDYEV